MANPTNKITRDKLEAAWELLTQETTTVDKLNHLRVLLAGVNPKLDRLLDQTSRLVNRLQQVHQGKVVVLTAESLPENTPQQKKRKKALLLFLSSWNSLRSEVKRIRQLTVPSSSSSTPSPSRFIPTFVKGPFGVITIAAAAIVAATTYVQKNSVALSVANNGCPTLIPVASQLPSAIPGLASLRNGIPNGSSAQINLPPLTLNTSGTDNQLTVSTLGLKLNFNIDPGVDIRYNGQSLLNRQTTIKLSGAPRHTLEISCSAIRRS